VTAAAEADGPETDAAPAAEGDAFGAALRAGALLVLAAVLSAWAGWSFRGAAERRVLLAAVGAAIAFALAARTRAGPASLRGEPSSRAAFLIAFAVALGASVPALRGSFLADDLGYIQLFHAKPLSSFLRLGDVSEGIWGFPLDEMRPLFALTYKLDYMLYGPSEAGYHLTNLLIHAVCAGLVVSIAAAAGAGGWTAALAGALFALLPVHAEPVSWITGKVDSLPTAFYLAAFYFFLRFRRGASRAAYGLSLLAMAVGLFCKEILLTLPAVLVGYDAVAGSLALSWPRSPRAWARPLAVYVPFGLVAFGYAVLRRLAVGSFGRESALGWGAVVRFTLEQDFRLRHLLVPFPRLLGDGPPPDAATAVLAGIVLGGVIAGAGLLYAARRRFARAIALVVFFGPVWYGLTVLPLLVTYRAARHLYLPSAGIAVALALLILPTCDEGRPRRSVLRLALAALLAMVYATLLVGQNGRWLAAAALARQSRADLAAIASGLPAGSTVVIDNLEGFRPGGTVYFWRWSLPFALRPPFVAADLYAPLRVLEPPEVYCCPASVWWRDKRAFVAALVEGPPEEAVEISLVHWNEHRGELVRRSGRPTRGRLRLYVERALAGPVAACDSMDPRKAERLLNALATAVRQSPGSTGSDVPEP
jgi:hypothetical protein